MTLHRRLTSTATSVSCVGSAKEVCIADDHLAVSYPVGTLAYILILLLFAVSNGYLCSLLIMRAVVDPALEADEVDIASSIMLVYLTAGLVSGAILSFVSHFVRYSAMLLARALTAASCARQIIRSAAV